MEKKWIIEKKDYIQFFLRKAMIRCNHKHKAWSCIKVIFLVFYQSWRILKGSRVDMGLGGWRDSWKTWGKNQVASFQIAFVIPLAIANIMKGDDSHEKFTLSIQSWLLQIWTFSTEQPILILKVHPNAMEGSFSCLFKLVSWKD